jgi:hypothetical protein
MPTKRFVRESGDGWEVLAEGHRRSAIVADTREKAIARARGIVSRQGGGEIRVVNRVGKVVDSRTVARPAQKRAGTRR